MVITAIIPAHNAHKTIGQTLLSIANQMVLPQVIIVDDCSDNGYDDIVAQYPQLNTTVHRLQTNGGPGVARREGLALATTPYVTFIDADDIYLDAMFFDGVIRYMNATPTCAMVSAGFIEEGEGDGFIKHTDDMTWVFGKIYRRQYLLDKGITFSDLRANEDLEFNSKIRMTVENESDIFFLNDKFVYLWKYNENSITRRNDYEYSYHSGLIGAIEAKLSAYHFNGVNKERAIKESVMESLYFYNQYCSILADRPQRKDWAVEVLTYMRKFYNTMCKASIEAMDERTLAYLFNSRDLRNSKHFIPTITFYEFLNLLKQ